MKKDIYNPANKAKITFIRTAEQTDGKFSELNMTLAPGSVIRASYHNNHSLTIRTMEGELNIGLDEKKVLILQRGEEYHIAAGQVYHYLNATEQPVTYQITIKPGSSEIENSLRILFGLAKDGLVYKKGVPIDNMHKAVIASMGDLYLPGIYKHFRFYFEWLAQRAEKSGLKDRLIQRYCQ